MSVGQRTQSPFAPVARQLDLPALEHDILRLWTERRAFARLREQNAGHERWSFLDGPITANNPMGVHHAWGRMYKDLFQRYHAMLGHDQRYQNGFDCQGLWVEVNVERELGFTSKRDIESFGIAQFINLCKQRVLKYAALQTEQSIRLGMWMDWNDPSELLRLHDLLGADPAQQVTVEGRDGPVTDSVEMIVGRLGMPELGGSYFTFSNENNYLIWLFLAECKRRGWLYKGHDSMPWCTRCGTGISQMEMNEGYQDREDPGLTVRLPLVDRPGEWLLVWTTTPWTLAANVAAAVGPELTYVKVRQGDDDYWIGKGTLKTALRGEFKVLEEQRGTYLVDWRYRGPFDELPAVTAAFAGGKGDDGGSGYEHRVVAWDEVSEEEGTGIVHIAPGAGAEDYHLGRSLGLPVIAPLTEDGHYVPGFGWLSSLDAHAVAERVVEDLQGKGLFYHLEPYTHRYPHCWRCGTALLFRVVDEWYISMGEVYDKPRDQVTAEEKERSLRYQIMDVVDQIRWLPGFGYERELDWLRTMSDWMISKKRYWGLALPIWECASCGNFDVIGSREELEQRAVAGWDEFDGHTPHRPHIDAVKVACSSCGAQTSRIPDVGNPWLDAGIVSFSTLHYREEPDYWAKWFPADFITESFPGQFRNWFYSLLAMSTVLRGEPPFKTILGYATLFGEDGRPMHKSWGNSIEFNEAAERMGVDVMRWMYAKQRAEDNILFGYHTADEARRELLVLWNVYAFFMQEIRRSGWTPAVELAAPVVAERQILDRWILARVSTTVESVERELENFDARGATLFLSRLVDDLSTWYVRLSRKRFVGRTAMSPTDMASAFVTLRTALAMSVRALAPILPFLSEAIYQAVVYQLDKSAPNSIHLTKWPTDQVLGWRDVHLEDAMSRVRRAVELARNLRSRAGLRQRQPLARVVVAIPEAGNTLLRVATFDEWTDLLKRELNADLVEIVGWESEIINRRVRPVLPVIGKKYGSKVPEIMDAARSNDVDYLPDGSVRLAGVTLAPSEVEVYAVAAPGTEVASDQGIAVLIETNLTVDLLLRGDANEIQRTIQDLRKQLDLEPNELASVWLTSTTKVLTALQHRLGDLYEDTSTTRGAGSPPRHAATAVAKVTKGEVSVSVAPLAAA